LTIKCLKLWTTIKGAYEQSLVSLLYLWSSPTNSSIFLNFNINLNSQKTIVSSNPVSLAPLFELFQGVAGQGRGQRRYVCRLERFVSYRREAPCVFVARQ